jgi:TetR/AcrR family transcriptional repressor of nem operon
MPRFSAEHKRESHERILEAATRLFKSRGYAGTGLKEIMEAAGLTVGTFYAHFDSKAELFCEMFQRAGSQTSEKIRLGASRAGPERALHRLLANYLSEENLKAIDTGCPFAAMLTDLPRTSKRTRKTIESCLNDYVEAMLAATAAENVESRERFLATFSLLFGAMALARSVASDALARDILAAARSLALKAGASVGAEDRA